ncbi:MAG: hypothetical protein AAF702_00860 [Chloroflexota bacterium]
MTQPSANEVRTDIEPDDLLIGVGNLCLSTHDDQTNCSQRASAIVPDAFRRTQGKIILVEIL